MNYVGQKTLGVQRNHNADKKTFDSQIQGRYFCPTGKYNIEQPYVAITLFSQGELQQGTKVSRYDDSPSFLSVACEISGIFHGC